MDLEQAFTKFYTIVNFSFVFMSIFSLVPALVSVS